MTSPKKARLRNVLLALAGLRAVLALIAIPLAPVLYRENFVALVLLRPTKEVLLAGGFLLRQGEVSLLGILPAAIPLSIFGVWLFFALGRTFADEIKEGKRLPRWAERVLPPDRVKAMCSVLERKGRRVIVLGRLAAFPSTMLGAGAGASDMPPSAFLPADGLGALAAMAEVLVAGYFLGAAYKSAGPWLTATGVVVLLGLLVALGRWLRRQNGTDQRRSAAPAGSAAESSEDGT